ncbi:MAG: 2-amino-4-hydroxy-6-hydroxymethyldihydropteridine diphosphokinase [Planctomycetaceae bacterium]
MTVCLIALGGNLGSSELLFQKALEQLHVGDDRVLAVSRNFETRAVGEQSGGGFLNAAAVLDFSGSPLQLLSRLQAIELDCGRERLQRWGPRTLDLDLLLFGQHVQWESRLIVPHPAMWLRRFVLSSAVEVAGEMLHPVLEQSIAQLWQRLSVPQFCVSVELVPELAGAAEFTEFLKQPLQLGAVSFRRLDSGCGVLGECFAHLQLRRAEQLQPPWSYPDHDPGARTMVLFVQSPENAVEQLRQTATAITG